MAIHCEKLVEPQEIKLTKVCTLHPATSWSPGVFNSQSCPLSLQKFVSYTSDLPVSELVPAELSAPVGYESLHSPVSSFSFGDSVFGDSELALLGTYKEWLIFSVFQVFLVAVME